MVSKTNFGHSKVVFSPSYVKKKVFFSSQNPRNPKVPDFETCHIFFKATSVQKENNGHKMNDEDHRRLAFGKRVTREPSVKDSPIMDH